MTIEEIEEILERYQIEEQALSNLLGWPEERLTRYIEGQIQIKTIRMSYGNIEEHFLYERPLREKE